MTVIPENASDSNNDEEQGQTQDNQAEVTGQVPEGTEQVQNQGNTGTTDGQEEHHPQTPPLIAPADTSSECGCCRLN